MWLCYGINVCDVQCRGPLTAITSQTPILNMASLQQEDDINAMQTIKPIVSNPKVTQPAQARGGGNTHIDACLQLIADVIGLDVDDLSGDAAFHELGVDSSMSLASSDKMRIELGIDIKASISIQCATVQKSFNWLDEVAVTSRSEVYMPVISPTTPPQ